MIYTTNGLLDNDELQFLDNFCKEFKTQSGINFKNYYNRAFLDENINLLNFQKKANKYLFEKFKVDYKITNLWVNRVTSETNKSDGFHLDEDKLTIVTYINTNFIGGEFEYFSKTKPNPKIKPERNLSLIMDNKLPHKVLPVSHGERFSLVAFYTTPTKGIKTML